MKSVYTILLYDNFHHGEYHKYRDYGSSEEAIQACKVIVDDYLMKAYKKNISEEDLFSSFSMFGEEPVIDSIEKVEFSAWEYAKQRAAELTKTS